MSFDCISVCIAILISLSLSRFSFFFSVCVFRFISPACGVVCNTSASDLPVSSIHAGSSCVTIPDLAFSLFLLVVGSILGQLQ